MPTPRSRSPRSTRSSSITTSSSRGTRPRTSCSRSSRTCSATGRPSFRPPFEGIRVVSHRWSARAHEIKDYLARNQIPYRWLDIETEAEASELAASAGVTWPPASRWSSSATGRTSSARRTPRSPSAVGLRTHAALPYYDLVIVGGGPSGLAAAVYGASEGLKTLMVEREAPGGQAGTTSRIDNYLGFPAGLSGADLARRAVAQASRLGAEVLTPQEVVSVTVEDPYKVVRLADGSQVSCQALLVATGVEYRKLDLPDADRLAGSGIYYGGATTEASFYRGQRVAVQGGGNSAGQAAVYLARFAEHVTVLVRADSLASGMSAYLVDQIEATPNITVRVNVSVAALHGGETLESVDVAEKGGRHRRNGCRSPRCSSSSGRRPARIGWATWSNATMPGSSSRVAISRAPASDPAGWPLAREPFLLETNVPGIFCAGDVRSQLRQADRVVRRRGRDGGQVRPPAPRRSVTWSMTCDDADRDAASPGPAVRRALRGGPVVDRRWRPSRWSWPPATCWPARASRATRSS